MTYLGVVKNGDIVLEAKVELPDGVAVRVELPTPTERSEWSAENGNEELWRAVRSLPEDMSFEDVIEKLHLLYKVDRGMRQLRTGQGIPHEEVRKRFSKWLA